MTSGAPIAVFVHSSGLGPGMWRAYQSLEPDVHVVAPALNGYEPRALLPADSVAADLGLVAKLVDAAPTPVHLVGHSYGGYVAARVALARPDRIASLALLEPVLFGALRLSGDPDVASDLRYFDEGSWFNDATLRGTAAWLEPFLDYWNGAGAWAAMTSAQRAPFLAAGEKVFDEVRAVSTDPLPFERYRYAVPLLLIRGARTTIGARRIVDRLAGVNPGARVVEVPDAGHMFPVTHRRTVMDELKTFWAIAEQPKPD